MQTFLPYASFKQSAQCLDRMRLGKQRVEVLQILRTLTGESEGWRNHPAVRMWRGREHSLALYGDACVQEWIRRGYKNTIDFTSYKIPGAGYYVPDWFGDKEFHASHRSNLLRKDPAHYSQFNWPEPPDLPYVWPL